MKIIEINTLLNGAHRNQTNFNGIIPEGWAIIPDELETPNFPFGEIEIDENNIVISWTPIDIPEEEEEELALPSQLDLIEAQVAYTAMMTGTLLEA